MSRYDEIRARIRAASMEGAIATRGNAGWHNLYRRHPYAGLPHLVAYVSGESYADLFAHSAADMAYLLDEIDRLRAALQQAGCMRTIKGARRIVEDAL